jgi:hypothetical protein
MNRKPPKNYLDFDFFLDLDDLLDKHIAPKSKTIAKEIYTIVEAVCRSHAYEWKEKNRSVGGRS